MSFGKKLLLIICIIIVLLVVAFVLYPSAIHPLMSPISAPSTSSVPTSTPIYNVPNSWLTYSSSTTGVSFRYPGNLGTSFIQLVDWPPAVQVLNQSFACTEAGEPNALGGLTVLRAINGRAYCITTETEGAAGSLYSNYAYVTAESGGEVIFTFSLKFPQCVNYTDVRGPACQSEESAFNIDPTIGQIVSTLSISK